MAPPGRPVAARAQDPARFARTEGLVDPVPALGEQTKSTDDDRIGTRAASTTTTGRFGVRSMARPNMAGPGS